MWWFGDGGLEYQEPADRGDDIKFDATWALSDTKNVLGMTNSAPPGFLMAGGSASRFGSANSIAFGSNTDGVYTAGSLELTLVW